MSELYRSGEAFGGRERSLRPEDAGWKGDGAVLDELGTRSCQPSGSWAEVGPG